MCARVCVCVCACVHYCEGHAIHNGWCVFSLCVCVCGQKKVMAKKKVKIDIFLIFCSRNFSGKWRNWRASCLAATLEKRRSVNYFVMFSTTRGQTSTWQCCYGVGGFSAVDCRQYVRRNMPINTNCVLLPLHFHVFSSLFVSVSRMFVTVCTVKMMWVGGSVTVIILILSIRKHWFKTD